MYSKMPTKPKICIFFRFGLPTISKTTLRVQKIPSGGGGSVSWQCFPKYFKAIRTSPEEQYDPRGSVPDFLRKPVATCDFPGEEGGLDPRPPSGSTHESITSNCYLSLESSLFAKGSEWQVNYIRAIYSASTVSGHFWPTSETPF